MLATERAACMQHHKAALDAQQIPVAISKRPHPIPSRTRKLSSSEPMVLQGQPCGRVGRCRVNTPNGPESNKDSGPFAFCLQELPRTVTPRLRGSPSWLHCRVLRFGMERWKVVGVLAGALSLGCSSDDDEFQYGEAEMHAAVVGAWTGELTRDGQPPSSHELLIERAGPGSQPTCGSRTFSQPQCSSSSSMSLAATLTSDDGLFAEHPLTGYFGVYGLTFRGGELFLSGTGTELRAVLLEGAFEQGTMTGTHTGSFTMTRK